MKENLIEEKVETLFETLKKRHRKNSKIQCPAFKNEPIHLNTIFWKHLKYQKNKRNRTVKDLHNRLISLDVMFDILKTVPYYQDYFTGKDKNNIIHFWTILVIVNHIRYGIIIRKIGKQGNKHLYSIIPNWKGYIPRIEASEHKIKIQ
jgi:hypothetical protein